MEDFDDSPGGFLRDAQPRGSHADPAAAFQAANTQNEQGPPVPPAPAQGGWGDGGQQQQQGAYPGRNAPAQGGPPQQQEAQPYPDRQQAANAWGAGQAEAVVQPQGQRRSTVHDVNARDQARDHFGGEDEILEIPALDEEEEEDITKQVAEPSQGHALQLKSVQELAGYSPTGRHSQVLNLSERSQEGIDLSILMKGLCRAQVVCDTDDAQDQTWSHETLLQQTLSEFSALQNEKNEKLGA